MTTQDTDIPDWWIETTLGEVIYPVSETHRFKDFENVHFLNTGDILAGKLLHLELSTISKLPWQAKKIFSKGDILFSEIRPENKRYMLVDFDSTKSVASTKLMVLRTKTWIETKFIYQFLTADDTIKEFQAIAESRSWTFPQITFDAISYFKILLPPQPEQKAIAQMLSSFDDKIELLREQNETLEKTAQTIFQEWFGKYWMEDDLPEGWRVGKVKDFGQIVCGKTPPKDNPDYFGGNIPFIKIPDMHGEAYIVKTEDSLTDNWANFQKNKFVPRNSICVSCIATVGLVVITSEDSQTNQQINSIIPNEEYFLEYLYLSFLNLKDELMAIWSGGSATLNVNTSVFSNINLIFPEKQKLDEFHIFTKPIFEKILSNLLQIQSLSKTRDELLPRLMSGEILLNNKNK